MISSMPRLRLAFSFTRMSPRIGFGDGGQTQLQAGAPRCALHFRNFAQHLLHVADHAIGFCQRTASRHDVVDDESALVHLRQQVRSRKTCSKHTRATISTALKITSKPGPLERATQPALVKVDDA